MLLNRIVVLCGLLLAIAFHAGVAAPPSSSPGALVAPVRAVRRGTEAEQSVVAEKNTAAAHRRLVTSLPDFCNFDSGLCSYSNTGSNDWLQKSGSTSSSGTGPQSGDHTSGSGYFMYTEATSTFNEVFTLESADFDQPSSVTFWYNMYGSSMGTLELYAYVSGVGWTLVWTKTGNQGQSWLEAEVVLASSVTRIKFVGTTGSSYTSDMAIDDVLVSSLVPTSVPTSTFRPTTTFTPSGSPTLAPTLLPTFEPSSEPTTLPSLEPTRGPTMEPSPGPTRLPTMTPTELPSVSPKPTGSPTRYPSPVPTTPKPTVVPTPPPSRLPTILPTIFCESGKRIASTTSGCTPCEVGKFSSGRGGFSCTPCSPGYYNPLVGETACYAATSGTYVPAAGSTATTSCPAGKYSTASAATSCNSCVAGSYQSFTRQTSCISCPAGSYTSTTGSATCAECPAGSYSGSTGADSCTACPAGKYQGDANQISCDDCLLGKYASGDGATYCFDCDQFYYAFEYGATECKECACLGEAGAKQCNEETGACVCEDLWANSDGKGFVGGWDIDNVCDEEADVQTSAGISYTFFALFLLYLPCFVCFGNVARVAGVWRRDLGVLVHRMKQQTELGQLVRERHKEQKGLKTQERHLQTWFRRLDKNKEGCVNVDEMKPFFDRIHIQVGGDELKYILRALLSSSNSNHPAESGLPFHLFRELISVVAQKEARRLADAKYRDAFTVIDQDKSGTVDEEEMHHLVQKLGTALTAEDLKGPIGERLSLSHSRVLKEHEFVEVMRFVQQEKRHQIIKAARIKREAAVRRVFNMFATSSMLGDDDSLRQAMDKFGPVVSKEERNELVNLVSDGEEMVVVVAGPKGKVVSPVLSPTDSSEGTQERHGGVSYRVFCRCLASLRLKDATFWPVSKYAHIFVTIGGDEQTRGFVNIDRLGPMLFALGLTPSADEIASFKDEFNDRGDSTLLFGDFCDVASRNYNVRLEYDILKRLEDKAEQLKAIILDMLKYFLLALPVIAALFCFHLVTLVVDVYLMAQSFYPNTLHDRIKGYKAAVSLFFDSLRPLPFYLLDWPFSFSLDLVGFFALNINMDAGVSCDGLKAPCYLALNVLIIALVIALFDSCIFIFVKVSPHDYESTTMTETMLIKLIGTALGRNTKTLIQIIIAKLYVIPFLPYWEDITEGCELRQSGAETVAQYGSSMIFWMLLPCVIHLLLNTFIYGLAPAYEDPLYGHQITRRETENLHFRLQPIKTSATEVDDAKLESEVVATQIIADADTGVSRRSHIMTTSNAFQGADWKNVYSSRICDSYYARGPYRLRPEQHGRSIMSFSKLFCPDTLKELESDGIEPKDIDLLRHNPEFWQCFDLWQDYFIYKLADGDRGLAFKKYCSAMLYKVGQLIKLSFGYWDNSLLENMQIKQRAVTFDVDRTDGSFKHENIISAMGVAHSMIWQFMPYCVFLAKLGEHFNQSPVLVFDGTPQLIIEAAKDSHEKYLSFESVESGGDEEDQSGDHGSHSVWSLEHDATKLVEASRLSKFAHDLDTEMRLEANTDKETYWVMSVKSPHVGSRGEALSVDGEGMLVWATEEDENDIPKGSSIQFLAYDSENGLDASDIAHGRQLTSLEAQRVVFNTSHEFGEHTYSGVPGANLPTKVLPLFCGSLAILVRLSTAPDAASPPKFKFHACYSEVPPVSFSAGKTKRSLNFGFYAITFISKMLLVFSSPGMLQRLGVGIWTFSAVCLTFVEFLASAWDIVQENADALKILNDPDAWDQMKELGIVNYMQFAFASVFSIAFVIASIVSATQLANYGDDDSDGGTDDQLVNQTIDDPGDDSDDSDYASLIAQMVCIGVIAVVSLIYTGYKAIEMGLCKAAQDIDLSGDLLVRKDFFDRAASAVMTTGDGVLDAEDRGWTERLGDMAGGKDSGLIREATSLTEFVTPPEVSTVPAVDEWKNDLVRSIENLGGDVNEALAMMYSSLGLPGSFPGAEMAQRAIADAFATSDTPLPSLSELSSVDDLSEMADTWSEAIQAAKAAAADEVEDLEAAVTEGIQEATSLLEEAGEEVDAAVDDSSSAGYSTDSTSHSEASDGSI